MRKSLLPTFAAALSMFAFAHRARADATANLGVTATVSGACTITGNTLAFGPYDTVSGAAVDGSTTLAVACTTGTTTTVTLGQGANPAAGSTDAAPLRQMKDAGTDFLGYQLFQDAARSIVWGNTVATGEPYTATSSAPVNLTVYGRIAAGQDVPAGSYADTVIATIAF